MKLLVTPLDWGLGHATRLIPIVRWLIDNNHDVILAGSGNSLKLLTDEFPKLKHVQLKSFRPWYNATIGVALSILIQTPKFLYCYHREKHTVKRLVEQHGIECIISDNRYGVRSGSCKSYIITHQLTPKCGIGMLERFEPLFARLLARWINRFDCCLIPDIKPCPNGLSGKLSDTRYLKIPHKHIGALSRLKTDIRTTDEEPPIEWLGIISGQEPHRTMFEEELKKMFGEKTGRRVIICGKVATTNTQTTANGIETYSYADTYQLSKMIHAAHNIVCRSGYSTIMDLYTMKKKAILIPTPGQAEQEYLSEYLKNAYICETEKTNDYQE
jgi:hypothetical protein